MRIWESRGTAIATTLSLAILFFSASSAVADDWESQISISAKGTSVTQPQSALGSSKEPVTPEKQPNSCQSTDDCPQGLSCLEFVCRERGGDNESCLVGERFACKDHYRCVPDRANPLRGVCKPSRKGQPCDPASSFVCPEGQWCFYSNERSRNGYFCAAPSTKPGAPCVSGAEWGPDSCQPGEYCSYDNPSKCVRQSGHGEACDTHNPKSCSEGNYCKKADPTDWRSTRGVCAVRGGMLDECSNDLSCRPGFFCGRDPSERRDKVCQPVHHLPGGEECVSSKNCKTGICEIPPGMSPYGTCAKPKNRGERCQSYRECESGRCVRVEDNGLIESQCG